MEWGGNRGKFGYKLSAGATYIHMDNDNTDYSGWVFTPKVSFSYSMRKGSVLLQLSSQPVIPAISQLSNNSEQVVPGLIRQGNPYLKNGSSYVLNLYYSHHNSWIDFTVGFVGNIEQ